MKSEYLEIDIFSYNIKDCDSVQFTKILLKRETDATVSVRKCQMKKKIKHPLTFSSLIKFSFILFLYSNCLPVPEKMNWKVRHNVQRDLRGPLGWQTVNPSVPHTSPFPLQHQSPLSLNNELTNYVLTSKTRVKESKERENRKQLFEDDYSEKVSQEI